MRLRVMLVDDEDLARQRLKKLLQKYSPEIHSIQEASNGAMALEEIVHFQPDVLFLDIHLPGLDGFQLLSRLKVQPFIVFVTAYDDYALKAFEEKSVDYLLKPVTQQRLDKTFDKLRLLYSQSLLHLAEDTRQLLDHLGRSSPKHIYVKSGDRIFPVPLSEIVYFEARDKSTFLHGSAGCHMIEYTLEQLEKMLNKDFERIHRSFIVNTNNIREIVKWFGGRYKILLNDKNRTELLVSRRYAGKMKWAP